MAPPVVVDRHRTTPLGAAKVSRRSSMASPFDRDDHGTLPSTAPGLLTCTPMTSKTVVVVSTLYPLHFRLFGGPQRHGCVRLHSLLERKDLCQP